MKEKLKEHRPIIIICVLIFVILCIYAALERGIDSDKIIVLIAVIVVLLFTGGVIAMSLMDQYYKVATKVGFVALVGAVATWIIAWFILMGLMVEPIVLIGPFNGPYGEAGGITTNGVLAVIPAIIIAGVITAVGKPIERKFNRWYSQKKREIGVIEARKYFEETYGAKFKRITKICIIIVIAIIILVASWALYRVFSLPVEENTQQLNVLEETDFQEETSTDDNYLYMDDEAYEKTPVERGYPSNDLQYYINHPDEPMPKELIDQVTRPDYEDIATPNY